MDLQKLEIRLKQIQKEKRGVTVQFDNLKQEIERMQSSLDMLAGQEFELDHWLELLKEHASNKIQMVTLPHSNLNIHPDSDTAS